MKGTLTLFLQEHHFLPFPLVFEHISSFLDDFLKKDLLAPKLNLLCYITPDGKFIPLILFSSFSIHTKLHTSIVVRPLLKQKYPIKGLG